MKYKSKHKYSVLSNVWFLTKDIAREHPLLLLFLLLEMTLAVVSPVMSLYLPKLAVDLVTTRAENRQIILQVGALGLLMTAAMALTEMAHQGRYMMYNQMRQVYLRRLYLKFLTCDYNQIESAEGQNKYSRAVHTVRIGDWSGTSQIIVNFSDLVVAILCFLLYSTIISTLNVWLIVLLVALTCLNLFAVSRAQRYEETNKDETAKLNRQMQYIESTADNWRWGKDIRLYAMDGWLISFRELLLDAFTALNRKIRSRYFAADMVNAFTLFLRDALTYGFLIGLVSTGEINIGDFVLYFGAVTGFSQFVSRIVDDINTLHEGTLKMNDLRVFLDTTDSPEPVRPMDLPKEKKLSIEFRNVCFSYGEKQILKDFSLEIDAGEKIALVGINGAGKTTIVKLLCGFYRPDSGEILINGVNIQRYQKKDRFRLFSAVFQDILILPFTVAENVSMCLEEETDVERVEHCLRKVGLWEIINSYPKGIHSYMLKDVNEGIILSGGQNQKLLMARALYKNAPILILDEPTAALDPIAESETYEQFHSISREKTALYISHRLASTRFCDRIIFLKDGVISETGTHDELIKLGGDYAYMFDVQSQYYKEKGGEQLA